MEARRVLRKSAIDEDRQITKLLEPCHHAWLEREARRLEKKNVRTEIVMHRRREALVRI